MVVLYRRFGTSCPLNMGPIGCPETSIEDYHSTLRNIPEERRSQLYSFFNLCTRWGGWLTPRPGRFTPGNDAVPIVQETGWAPGPVCSCAVNLASTRIRSPDRTVQPVASRCTDYAIPAYEGGGYTRNKLVERSPP